MISSTPPENNLQIAEALFDKGQYAEAVEQYDRALASGADMITALRHKADALLALGKQQAAIDCHDKIISVEPNNVAALTAKGDLLVAIERHEEALEWYTGALNRNPEYFPALRGKAVAFANLGRFREALTVWDRALDLHPQNPQMFISKGDFLLGAGDAVEAMRWFQQAADARADSFKAEDWSARGDRIAREGNVDVAVQFYDHAIAADRSYFWAWRGKGLVLGRDPARRAEAFDCIETAIHIEPANAWLWVDKGNLYFAARDYLRAVECYEKAIAIDPKYVHGWLNKAVALENAEQYQSSILAYDKVIELDSSNCDAWLGKGCCVTRLGHYQEALQYYDRVIELNPDMVWAYNNKGWSLYQLGKLDDALPFVDKAIGLAPGEALPWANKVTVLLDLGRQAEAAQCLQEGLAVISDRAAALRMLGWFCTEHKFEHKQALDYYREALQLTPDDHDIKTAIAECLIKVGRYNEGREQASTLDAEPSTVLQRCVMRFLILASYALAGDASSRARELDTVLQRYRAWQEKSRDGQQWTWKFTGLVDAIGKSAADTETKFLLFTLIDLLEGKASLPTLSALAPQAGTQTADRDSVPSVRASTA